MAKRIPKRLKKEPLVESLWELRFSSEIDSIGNVLPGLIFQAFAHELAQSGPTRIEQLPAGAVPLQLRETDAGLRYVATVQLRGEPYAIQIGDHLVALSCARPYTGWGEFGAKIRRLVDVLKQTDLITKPERFSMKYIDMLPKENAPNLKALEATISLGGRPVNESLSLRTEVVEGEFVNIVQIISPAEAQLRTGERVSGILVDTDTIYNHARGDFWQSLSGQLDRMHAINKEMFFDLLTDQTIASLEPEY